MAKPHASLRNAKEALRSRRRSLPLREKVAQVIALQEVVLPAMQKRRPLKPWERVWKLDGLDVPTRPRRSKR